MSRTVHNDVTPRLASDGFRSWVEWLDYRDVVIPARANSQTWVKTLPGRVHFSGATPALRRK
jgi:hypothetical protein